MKNKFSLASAALTAALMAASSSYAATVTIAQQSDVHVMYDRNNQNAWYAATDYMVGSQSVTNVAAGAFRLTATDAAGAVMDFLAFCLEPLEGLDHPNEHEIRSDFSVGITQRLNTLAENVWDSVMDHRTAAAFQMAAWEITTETSGVYDVDSGHFKITGNGDRSNQAEETAQVWLDNIFGGNWAPSTSSYMILAADGTQDLLTNIDVTPVPLPSSGMTLMAAMGIGGFVARRRAKTAG